MPDPADLIPDARDLIRAAYQLLDQAAAADPGAVPPGVRENLAAVLRALPVPTASAADVLADLARHWDNRPG